MVNSEKLYAQALEAIAGKETQSALSLLERALRLSDNHAWHSSLGLCIAKERGQLKKGRDLCGNSLALEPENPLHYLNLAKIQLMSGHETEALELLREAMSKGESAEIVDLLGAIGPRKPPVFAFLSRDNPLNKWVGLLLHRIRLR